MKISNPTSVDADTKVVVTYTIEPGDPPSFFFEINDNQRRMDVSSGETFSVSGSFFTIPGDEGPHFIEAYNSSAVVGVNQPFAVGPTYTVLPPSSTSISTPPPPASPGPPAGTQTQKTTLPTNNPTQKIDNPTPVNSKQSTSTSNEVNLPPTVTSTTQIQSSSVSETATTLYESISGSTMTVVEETAIAVSPTSVSQTPSPFSANVPVSGSSRSTTNIEAIIGGAVAVIVAFGIVLWLFVRHRRRNSRRQGNTELLSPTVEPFLGFAPQPVTEKAWRGFDILRSSRETSRNSSSTGLSASTRESAKASSLHSSQATPESPNTQMEWVLRPTNDPPPGYTSHLH